MIILTGFMGSGKTTVGKILAEELRLPFVDLDEKIAEQTGLSPRHYILRFGEAAFRRMEALCLNRILNGGPCVLATGGGAVLDSKSRRLVLSRGFVVWLDPPLASIRQRLSGNSGRPLLPGNFSAMRQLYRQRVPFYRAGHCRCQGEGPPQAVAISVLERYKWFQCTQNF